MGRVVYLWSSRAAAEALHTLAWAAWATGRWGTAPDIRYFDTPVVVDNFSDEVLDRAA